ncbi:MULTISPECIES: D-alanyl-D-alanine carboxypeptidase/D-alanyl-D-alanine-endopeptidase [Streptomyces]|uniref:D-alanyl-D-alanine carboxypeptidase/D-alanyl-D-alanine-endopeptidase n=1 Tax=Streptomyces caniscabiei TaxID=2746961 RepID=A0ABU4MXZ2_9ACTN|nr:MULTISPECIES: D-alanyl-D-alanine carboxypeptidase/D-alanyl-D-alanine-endopeptidase [Streptomyces]MBE4741565.1 D-alanyl-D-alanine carboxypeptidase/D-alanyl-D-alanine-endopeptidase [Streptomyces caniscabiei]MBE4761636.1 D-alanyl-D-alanine carboxypeptidase/D-alanyl-D-alanine-endopeptidase [Streptomyces caniscabiei]MBE4775637.1 D-alanyl-D-alanine carboxypeptidase/D-alanyl-D-alanine-endopeptidase [Streptomyces caniscabiei]MBE4790214.1 D-alanyl-D-alanine carboxypeptidase/D-alanyl-D-alanine-endopep
MVVREPKVWRAARPRVARVVHGVKPGIVRVTRAVKPGAARVAQVVKPGVVRVTSAVTARSSQLTGRARKLTTLQFTAGAATLGLVFSAGAVAAAGPWDSSGQRTAERDWAASPEGQGGADHGGGSGTSSGSAAGAPKPAPSAPSVLAGLGGVSGAGSVPDSAALAARLDPLLTSSVLGPRRAASVVDVETGEQLYAQNADDALTPASTTKIATAAAALSALGPDHRIETRTVLKPDSAEVVLVGGGDPTLSGHKDTDGYASLRTLADRTAAALDRRHLNEITLAHDTSLYEGPEQHTIGANPNLALVVPLMVDEARLDDSSSGQADRDPDPVGDATAEFADLLEDRGVKVRTGGSATAPKNAKELAAVSSPPLSTLVERMLTNSDNDIAEALARQVALATGEQPSFEGGAAAIKKELKKLEVPLEGVEFADGSGLSRGNALTPALLTALLARSAAPDHPGLRPVLTGLPVAGFTGTLRNRYPSDADGTGVVRAKTGTLSNVNTLAGTVVDADGRLLAFAFLATETPLENTDPAKNLLTDATSTLATCGCR